MKVKTKRTIAETTGWVLLLLALGIIGDIEPLAKAVVDVMLPSNFGGDALAALLAGAGCLRKAGVLHVR